MTDFSEFKAQIRDWAVRSDWSDDLVTSYVRMAEERFNESLRVDRMIQWDEGLITNRCAELPDDWLAMDLVRMQDSNGADGFLPIRYIARDHFFNLTDGRAHSVYTIEGRQIFFGGAPDLVNGRIYKISYYGEVPVFSDDTDSWIYTKYPSLYLFAALINSNLWQQGEESKAEEMEGRVDKMIEKLNVAHLGAKASGSRVTRPRVRSFG